MPRISQLAVTHLFGNFSHTIDMHLDDRITIIHGPNGFGKTALLRLVNAIFHTNYAVLRSIPFRTFDIFFDDGSHLIVEKKTSIVNEKGRRQKDDKAINLTFKFRTADRDLQEYRPKSLMETEEWGALSRYIERMVPGLIRTGPLTWRYIPTDEDLTPDEIMDRFGEMLSPGFPDIDKEPNWLRDLKNSVDVRFIEAQRLLKSPKVPRTREPGQAPTMVPTVTVYSSDLANLIKTSLADYAALSQSLDRTFPARLVTRMPRVPLTSEEIKEKLRALEMKRMGLIEAGLLDQAQDFDFQIPRQIEDSQRTVLSVYVNDVEEKLGIFDEIARKIELLREIVTKRFQYKRLKISKDKGFDFVSHDGTPLVASDLSSGEQQELVLLYELLFNLRPNSLIMIDEPELSLHVAWQIQFLDDLQKVIALTGFDILLATHSPQIINDRWDLTVELLGPAR